MNNKNYLAHNKEVRKKTKKLRKEYKNFHWKKEFWLGGIQNSYIEIYLGISLKYLAKKMRNKIRRVIKIKKGEKNVRNEK